MSERAQVMYPVPAVAAQFLWSLLRFHVLLPPVAYAQRRLHKLPRLSPFILPSAPGARFREGSRLAILSDARSGFHLPKTTPSTTSESKSGNEKLTSEARRVKRAGN